MAATYRQHRNRKDSALVFILRSMVPYSRENFMLAFKPSRFFYELERISNYKRPTLQSAYYRARRSGLIETSRNSPKLTTAGRIHVQPFIAKRLSGEGKLMVIFDVPEYESSRRRQFRLALRRLNFIQVQQSVWMTEYDHTEIVTELIENLALQDCVQLYEAAKLYPPEV